ncbi:hypothetical protein K504DRAFT_109100 [Pleomassaria siparia CBS 279.74]|uniref:Secreted protein n=1 Tax=Pleomassaria siparia CBS 279.74 TaxID=1314801 RepID=A0A6G1JWT6_9PLEO|nr:hypothetical protein K504DRAFT_109100 [Pleomassaria siparia CBS 279.74]
MIEPWTLGNFPLLHLSLSLSLSCLQATACKAAHTGMHYHSITPAYGADVGILKLEMCTCTSFFSFISRIPVSNSSPQNILSGTPTSRRTSVQSFKGPCLFSLQIHTTAQVSIYGQ